MNNQIAIQDVFHQFLPEYSETHLFSEQQQMTALCISKCRTAQMGANINQCESCNKQYIHYNSCKNRHCPMCQGMDVEEWIVYTKEAFNGANCVIKYLGRYTHWIAISNRCIISMTSETVTYLAKDYKNGGKMIPYTVKGTDFGCFLCMCSQKGLFASGIMGFYLAVVKKKN